jgi:hypothetical protein
MCAGDAVSNEAATMTAIITKVLGPRNTARLCDIAWRPSLYYGFISFYTESHEESCSPSLYHCQPDGQGLLCKSAIREMASTHIFLRSSAGITTQPFCETVSTVIAVLFLSNQVLYFFVKKYNKLGNHCQNKEI